MCTDRLTRLLLFFFSLNFQFCFFAPFFCFYWGWGSGGSDLFASSFFFFNGIFSFGFCTLLFSRFAFTGGWGSGGSKLYQNVIVDPEATSS